MKFIRQFMIICIFTLIGEILNALVPFPVPAGVYGLFLLVFSLLSGIIKVDDVDTTGDYLLEIMPVMFVPVTVGLIEKYSEIKDVFIPLFVIMLVSTVLVMTVTGKVAEIIVERKEK